ncbi:unnamed protein product [Prorocentrum cordatum]|uniref:Uncharacterized protein n=1 Tax=Prorocentrum cordatum TaxID=2364126 RepID=A0ABN9SW52_9DINO|nr:unnamed protein product [Polarella glacialis]
MSALDFGKGLPHDCYKFAVKIASNGALEQLPPLLVPSCRFYRRVGYDRFLFAQLEHKRDRVIVVPSSRWSEFFSCLDESNQRLIHDFHSHDLCACSVLLRPGWLVDRWQLVGRHPQPKPLPYSVDSNAIHVHLSLKGCDAHPFKPFRLLGRRYELLTCWNRGGSSDYRQGVGSAISDIEAVFFATIGKDLDAPIKVGEVRDWHFPLEPACREGVAWAKYKDRFRLGFSGTLAVCGLRPEEEALIVPDMQSNAGECLSDGWGEVRVGIPFRAR